MRKIIINLKKATYKKIKMETKTFVNIPEIPSGVTNAQFQMFINMPENLQKRYIEFCQNQQRKIDHEAINKKLREAEERKNLQFAVKQ